jgi:hypothetical protein
MVATLRKLTKHAIGDYEEKAREEWVTCHASQVRRLTLPGGYVFIASSYHLPLRSCKLP